jgi:hypothetical protein
MRSGLAVDTVDSQFHAKCATEHLLELSNTEPRHQQTAVKGALTVG